jgi:hypothetical protein
MINGIIRDEHRLFDDRTRLYVRDGYDHTIQLMDIIETYQEIASGLIDVYISSMSARLDVASRSHDSFVDFSTLVRCAPRSKATSAFATEDR